MRPTGANAQIRPRARHRCARSQAGSALDRPASRLEARFHDLLADHGDPPFQRRVIISDADGIIGEVDCYDPSARLVVEIDSVRFHASPSDHAHDAARDARLRAIGMHVERITEPELLRQPGQVLARVRRARRQGAARAA